MKTITKKFVAIVLTIAMVASISVFTLAANTSSVTVTTNVSGSYLPAGVKVGVNVAANAVDGVSEFRIVNTETNEVVATSGASELSGLAVLVEEGITSYKAVAVDSSDNVLAESSEFSLEGYAEEAQTSIWDLDFEGHTFEPYPNLTWTVLNKNGSPVKSPFNNSTFEGHLAGTNENSITITNVGIPENAKYGESVKVAGVSGKNAQINYMYLASTGPVNVVSYDWAIASPADIQIFGMKTDAGYVLPILRADSEGNFVIGGVVGKYEANKWYNIKQITDLEHRVTNTFIDNVLVHTASVPAGVTKFELVSANCDSKEATFYLDNVNAYNTTLVKCAVDSGEEDDEEDEESNAIAWIDALPQGSGILIDEGHAGPNSYTYTQNNATLTISKVIEDSSYCRLDYGSSPNTLNFYGRTDGAVYQNSEMKFLFASPSEVNVNGSLVYLDFNLISNAPSRSYATWQVDNKSIGWLADPNSSERISDIEPDNYRIEIDSSAAVISGGNAAVVKYYKNGVLAGSQNCSTYPTNIGFSLASYKTPTITISDVEFGYEPAEGGNAVAGSCWISGVPQGSGILIDEGHAGPNSYTYSQNDANLIISKVTEDSEYCRLDYGTSGETLWFYGRTDDAIYQNSRMKFLFAPPVDADVYGGLVYLNFSLKTDAPGRSYAEWEVDGNSLSGWLADPNSSDNRMSEVTADECRMEIDSRAETATPGVAAVVKYYKNGVLVGSKNCSTYPSNIGFSLAAYKTPTITISGVEFGCEIEENLTFDTLDVSFAIDGEVVDAISKSGALTIGSTVYNNTDADNLTLIVATYSGDAIETIKLVPMNFTNKKFPMADVASFGNVSAGMKAKVMLWKSSGMIIPVCESAELK